MELVNEFLGALLALLPTSPFREFYSLVQDLPYLGVLNWFFPFGAAGRVLRVWLVAVGVYFFYNLIMRKVGLIQ